MRMRRRMRMRMRMDWVIKEAGGAGGFKFSSGLGIRKKLSELRNPESVPGEGVRSEGVTGCEVRGARWEVERTTIIVTNLNRPGPLRHRPPSPSHSHSLLLLKFTTTTSHHPHHPHLISFHHPHLISFASSVRCDTVNGSSGL